MWLTMLSFLLASGFARTETTKQGIAPQATGKLEVKPGYEQSEPKSTSLAAKSSIISCPQTTYEISLPTYGKTIHIHHEEKTWCDAQKFCRDTYGGSLASLWEPESSLEYNTVKSQAISLNPALSMACKWWIGVRNWSDNYGKDGNFASLTEDITDCSEEPSTSVTFTWKQITDGGDGNTENCVDIRGSAWSWGDERCSRKMKFICEEKKPTKCSCQLSCKQVRQKGNYAYCPAGTVPTSCSCGWACGSWNLLSNGCYCHIGCRRDNQPLDWTSATCCKVM